ncbi:hypothetical protein F2P81_018532 [Scophthalmus maximus]|uniref:Centrosomal protein of 83 kDa n=1 Tax=Scophthalmus maximus TaxID=52904 RepID=A0A6A4S8H1_SCOMX|nr:hypothetical protein F2P81_018532 [Scophthalmus maximus]
MTSSTLGQSAPLVANLEPGIGKYAAILGLSAGLGGAEMELQKMLIEERMKCENHRTNYQMLKAEHTSLQDEFTRSQEELKRLLSDRQAQQEKVQLLLVELRGELLDKTRELEELRLQEAEKYRSEYSKLRYENTIIKSQFEHAHMLEQRRIRHQAELSHLENDRVDLVTWYQGSDPLRDVKRVEALLRDKAQLHVQLKGLEAEVGELRARNENSGQQAENVQRIQIRQLSECQAAGMSLEAERQSLRLQLERMESELQLSHEQNSQLTGRLHKAEREVNSLTCEIESLKHSHKLEMACVKVECTRSKGEVERERDTLQGQLDGLQTDVEMLKAAVERHKDVVVKKDKEIVRNLQSAREEEHCKIATLHEERLELENRLAALEQQRALKDAANRAQKEEWEERLRSAQQGEESGRIEVQTLRTRPESHLMETNQRLREILDSIGEELRTTRGQAERSQHKAERMLEVRQVEWLEEKHKLQEREAELQQKHTQDKEKLQRAAVAQKKRKALTENREKKLQDKIQLLQVKIEELELEAAAAKKRPSFSQEQAQVQCPRLKELQRRQNEFRHLLLDGQAPFSGGPVLLTSSPTFFLRLGPEGPSSSNIPEEQNQREFSLLRQRLEDLESVQQQQLEELGSVVQRDQRLVAPTELTTLLNF